MITTREAANVFIEVAREVQNRIFPTARPEIPGLDYYSDWKPAWGLGGDYVDYFATERGELCLTLGDVAGKGLPVALLTSSLYSMVRALRASPALALPDLVSTIDELFRAICPDNYYATLFIARYDPRSRRLTYVNAGHATPLVLRWDAGNDRTLPLECGGPVIGMLRAASYREGVVSLNPGDLLVAYTDGLCDIMNPRGEEWGCGRMVETIRACRRQRSRDIVDQVIKAAERHAAGAPRFDDMTLWLGRVEDRHTAFPFYRAGALVEAVAA